MDAVDPAARDPGLVELMMRSPANILKHAMRTLGRRRRKRSPGLRPDFLIIGTMKGGTTSLFRYLEMHPGVAVSMPKEVHFFDDNHERGVDWYLEHFPGPGGGATHRGEASPYYLFCPDTPGRVHALLPDVRLIVMLRDPVTRAYSHFHHESRFGQEDRTFEEAIDAELRHAATDGEEPIHPRRDHADASRYLRYLARGLYAEQLERWFALFPREQILVLRSEDMFSDAAPVYADVLDWLGLPPHELTKFPKRNRGRYDAPLSLATRDRLREIFAPHNARLERLLGRSMRWGYGGSESERPGPSDALSAAATTFPSVGPDGSSDHIRRLSPDVRKSVAGKRLIFTVTTGRSGTDFLASVARVLPDVVSLHEPNPSPVDVFRWMHMGDPDLARRWWIELKLPRIAARKKPVYLETNHVYCKGFLEPLLGLGFTPSLILLRRANRSIASSLYELATIPGRTVRGDRWYLRPDDPGVLPLPAWETFHDYQLCYWYTLEIARRQAEYEELIAERGGDTLTLDLAELNSPEGFDRLARFVTGSPPSSWEGVRFRRLASRPRNVRDRVKEKRRMPPAGDLDALERAVHEAIGVPVVG